MLVHSGRIHGCKAGRCLNFYAEPDKSGSTKYSEETKIINDNEIKEPDSHWNEVMELAKSYGFICQAFAGTATLATHKNQIEAFGEEQYVRRQLEMFGRKIKSTEE